MTDSDTPDESTDDEANHPPSDPADFEFEPRQVVKLRGFDSPRNYYQIKARLWCYDTSEDCPTHKQYLIGEVRHLGMNERVVPADGFGEKYEQVTWEEAREHIRL
jgi:hypothetical protein